MKWDNRQACIEGWDLFDVDGRWQLQRIDDPSACPGLSYDAPKFHNDAVAIMHVAYRAVSSDYHYRALALIGRLVTREA